MRVPAVEKDTHVRRVARHRCDVDAAVPIQIGARDAARVLARTGLAHVLGRAELDFLGMVGRGPQTWTSASTELL